MFLVARAIEIWSRVRLDCARALNHGMITWRAMRAPRDQNTRVIDEQASTSRYRRNVISFLLWDTWSSDRFRPPVGKNRCIVTKEILLSRMRTKKNVPGESTRNGEWHRVCWSSGLIAIILLSVRTRAKNVKKKRIKYSQVRSIFPIYMNFL